MHFKRFLDQYNATNSEKGTEYPQLKITKRVCLPSASKSIICDHNRFARVNNIGMCTSSPKFLLLTGAQEKNPKTVKKYVNNIKMMNC